MASDWQGGPLFNKIRRGCAQRKGEHQRPCQRRQLRWFPQHQAYLATQLKLAAAAAKNKVARKTATG